MPFRPMWKAEPFKPVQGRSVHHISITCSASNTVRQTYRSRATVHKFYAESIRLSRYQNQRVQRLRWWGNLLSLDKMWPGKHSTALESSGPLLQ